MATIHDLIELEKQFWTGDAEYYRDHVDDDCLVAFLPMAGLKSREEVAASVKQGPRWNEPAIEVKGLIRPTPDFVILTYRAEAKREGDSYSALVSSGYIRRNDGWKLAFHQQTPAE